MTSNDILTHSPVIGRIELVHANEEPNAGEPVRQDREHGHEQSENHDAVLRVSIELLKESG